MGIVNAPVRAGKHLLHVVGVDDDRIHRDVWQVASLIRPGKRAAIRGACYLENVTRGSRCIGVKTAYSRISNRDSCPRGGIKPDTQHRTIGQDRVASSN